MKFKKFTIGLLLFLLLSANILIAGETSKQDILRLSQQFTEKYEREKAEAVRVAKEKGWVIRKTFSDGKVIELQRLGPNGIPIYYTTNNIFAAWTVGTDELWPGGSTGLDLTGEGFLIGEWDCGAVRTSHQEFDDGQGGTRVTQRDTPAEFSDHATHVAGTLVSGGS